MGSKMKGGETMGVYRNGARSFLDLASKLCKLSHLPGFKAGLGRIVGNAQADSIYGLWTPLCSVIEALVATDNYYNQIDRQDDDAAGEDTGGA
jgi:hypothetical protein